MLSEKSEEDGVDLIFLTQNNQFCMSTVRKHGMAIIAGWCNCVLQARQNDQDAIQLLNGAITGKAVSTVSGKELPNQWAILCSEVIGIYIREIQPSSSDPPRDYYERSMVVQEQQVELQARQVAIQEANHKQQEENLKFAGWHHKKAQEGDEWQQDEE